MNAQNLAAREKSGASPAGAERGTPKSFSELADAALAAMKRRAEELDIRGVALVAYAEGQTVTTWISKMVVVGEQAMTVVSNGKAKNLLGIAYTKAAEMADTLRDSGSKIRPPMVGEYGYQGGLVVRGKTGVLIAAFSGGPDESDLKVSRVGLDILSEHL